MVLRHDTSDNNSMYITCSCVGNFYTDYSPCTKAVNYYKYNCTMHMLKHKKLDQRIIELIILIFSMTLRIKKEIFSVNSLKSRGIM